MTTAEITLTPGQLKGLDAFYSFLIDPIETAFVLEGYSGCGKSTLVRTILDLLPKFMKTARLINADFMDYEVQLTATTNKAAENLYQIANSPVQTIHSFLGLRVQTDFRTGVTKLIPRNATVKEGYLLFIDEASFIDSALLELIFEKTKNCKIVFVGDPAQLIQVKATHAPVFASKFTGTALTEVVRQAEGNPIVELATMFRHTVNTGVWGSFVPDGNAIQHLDRQEFLAAIEKEFTRPDWKFADSKILGWTNKCVIGYNHYINNLLKGDPSFSAGDYAVCNSFVTIGKKSIKTDQMVSISSISEDTMQFDTLGNWFVLDEDITVFMPKSLALRAAALKRAKATDNYFMVQKIENEWIDLRSAAASTINKAQGSTYDKVFIDLDDIARCNSGDQIARMLYVGTSRARNNVYLTGDLA